MSIQIVASTDKEKEQIRNNLIAYNYEQVKFTQTPPRLDLNFVIKDTNGALVAGINSELYCWGILFVSFLWVSSAHRGKGYGAMLLKKAEQEAKNNQGNLIHLDTFDFQAKDFYLKQGFEIFGVLEDCPPGHNRYFLKKKI